MTGKVVFMFSGQGSQYYQMGKSLYEGEPEFRRWMDGLDEVARRVIGVSVVGEMYGAGREKSEPFVRTLYTHPAILMTEFALAKTLMARGVMPDVLFGASLGEFTAAALAEVVAPEEMFEWVIGKARIIEQTCRPGSMLAVIERPELYHRTPLLHENCSLAGVNYDEHFVVAGDRPAIEAAERYVAAHDILHQKLPVAFGYHSGNIDPAMSALVESEGRVVKRRPALSWVSCCLGGEVEHPGRHHFSRVARNPILFREAVQDVRRRFPGETLHWLDVGPSGTLANFVKKNLDGDAKTYAVMSPFGKDEQRLAQVAQQLGGCMTNNVVKRRSVQMKAIVFPGQGSQAKGMGRGLFEKYGEYVGRADEILGYSIEELCLHDPRGQLSDTRYTQPALYVVNALSYLDAVDASGETPAFVAGHSLGEYNALFAAGALQFETGLKMVRRRGELMAQAREGGMAAVIGLTEEQVGEVIRREGLSNVDLANLNTPTQIVISGPADDIERAGPLFEKAGCLTYTRLRVSGAFHSRLMEDARRQFAELISDFSIEAPKIPVISNVRARPYPSERLKELLIDQITHPVKWAESIRYLMGKGVKDFKEVGPGTVLTGLIRKIMREAEPLVVSEEEPEAKSVVGAAVARTITPAIPLPPTPPPPTPPPAPPPAPLPAAPAVRNEDGQRAALDIDHLRARREVTMESLGCAEFKRDYGVKYAYLSGSMYKGIASTKVVIAMGRAGMLGYFGAGGLSQKTIAEAIAEIQSALTPEGPYGINLLHGEPEDETVELYLKTGVRNIEAAAFMHITPALVKFRLAGIVPGADGLLSSTHRVLAKVSRPEVATVFLSPAPKKLVEQLLAERAITAAQAEWAERLPMADDLCVEADSGGHTDMGSLSTLMPATLALRDELSKKYGYRKKVRVGAAGGIGTPEAAAAAFILGADFILTGSINQCSVEAGTSDVAKEMLQDINVQDTGYAPAGDMFEMGSKVQVLKKGVFFPARANKLYELYRHYDALEDLPTNVRTQVEEKYFRRRFEQIYDDCKRFYSPKEIERAERNPKQKMAFVFRWYFGYATRLALTGDEAHKVDFQIQCGPALGAFNQWVKGTSLENWRNRHVDEMGIKILRATAELLNRRIYQLLGA
jgi:trans-AT polyketide synthase/acyltransferase/oxidoreductase domain-containing protein